MKRFLETLAKGRVFAYDAEPVMCEQNLAVTPSEMHRMSEAHIPITSSVLSQDLFDAGHDLGVNAPLSVFERRGIDFSEVSAYSQSCQQKLSKAYESISGKAD